MPYNFRAIPELGTVDELRMWLNEELKTLSQSLNESTELELRASRHAPDRPREGMIIHADGTSWNPGSGAGTYRFQNGIWVKIPIAGTDSVVGPGTTVDGEIVLFNGTTGNSLKRATGSGFVKATAGVYSVTASIANADLANMNAWTLKMRNNASAGAPQDQTINDLTEETSGDAANDFLMIWDASAGTMDKIKPNNLGIQTGGLTLITTASAPAAATWTITGLGGYKVLVFSGTSITQASGTSRALQIELSGNGGSSFGGIRSYIGGTGIVSGGAAFPMFFITRVDQTNNQLVITPGVTTPTSTTVLENGSIGPINAIRLSWSGAATNFTAGTADIYGLK